jgi:hypothetical protein
LKKNERASFKEQKYELELALKVRCVLKKPSQK